MAKRSKYILAAFVVMALAPTPALASSSTYLTNNWLAAGQGWATIATQKGVTFVETHTDHKSCPALALGYTGFTNSPNSGGNHTYTSATTPPCATYGTYWYPNPSGDYLHGAALNPNGSTVDHFDYCSWVYD